MPIALLLLAAGNSSRMRGSDKLLQPVDNMPCLRAMALRGLGARADVYVTLGPEQTDRRAALSGLAVHCVDVPDAADGMSRSVQTGVAALADTSTAVMILPADMPGITQDDIRCLMDHFVRAPATLILRAATEDGLPGHPILFAQSLFDRFSGLSGDRGAFHLVREFADDVVLVPLEGQRARQDLDTPEDWAAWYAQHSALQHKKAGR